MWKTAKLGELFKVASSKRVLKSQWKSEGIPFYRGREITALSIHGFVENKLFITHEHFNEMIYKYGVPEAGDIMITAIGTIGNSYIVKEEDKFYFKDGSVLWLSKQKKISSEYMNYWLKSYIFRDQLNKGNGATVDTLTIAKLQTVNIKLPPLVEQRRIVAKLDAMFAEIEKTIAIAKHKQEEVNNLAKSILTGELSVKAWKTAKLGDVCTVRRGTTITKKQTIEGEVPVVGGGMKPTYYHNQANRGANCITISGSGASAGFVNMWDAPIFASDCSTVEPKDATQLTKFVYYYLCFQQEYIYAKFRSGAAQPHVYAKDIATLNYSLMPLVEQQRIVAKLDAIFSETDKTNEVILKQTANYQALKSAVLSQELQKEVA